MLASSYPPTLLLPVYRTALPEGSTCGQRCVASESCVVASGSGTPPSDDTRQRKRSGPFTAGVKTILSSRPQLPPRPLAASHRVIEAPPATATFFSFPPAKNASHCPSGEKNGLAAPSVPASGVAWS